MRAPPSIPVPPALRQRWDGLTPRERLFLTGGILAVLAFLLYLLLPGGDEVEDEPIQMLPVAAPPPPMTSPVVPVVASAPPPAPIPTPGIEGLTLRGVMGGGPAGGAAIVSMPDGRQRVVRIGRELLPGMMLKEVGLSYAIASGGGGDIRLDLNRPGGVAVPPAGTASPAIGAPSPPGGGIASQREL